MEQPVFDGVPASPRETGAYAPVPSAVPGHLDGIRSLATVLCLL
jgi:hypothetical protein